MTDCKHRDQCERIIERCGRDSLTIPENCELSRVVPGFVTLPDGRKVQLRRTGPNTFEGVRVASCVPEGEKVQ